MCVLKGRHALDNIVLVTFALESLSISLLHECLLFALRLSNDPVSLQVSYAFCSLSSSASETRALTRQPFPASTLGLRSALMLGALKEDNQISYVM